MALFESSTGFELTRRRALCVVVVGLLLGGETNAQPPEESARYVASARSLLGVPYQFGGRMRAPAEGIDCQGILFFAFEAVTGCGWKSYSVFSTEATARQEYGFPVPGMSPVASELLDTSKLMPGDILFLVSSNENTAEKAIASLNGAPVWVWHTGMYSGNGKWIVGDHFAGQVVEVDLKEYLKLHADSYQGVFVSRIVGAPKPKRCRKHPPMTRH